MKRQWFALCFSLIFCSNSLAIAKEQVEVVLDDSSSEARIEDGFSDSSSDASFGKLIYNPPVHYYLGDAEITNIPDDAVTTLKQLTANNCMDIYTPAGEEPEFGAVLTKANQLADWLASPTHQNRAQLVFIQQEGSMPEPKMEDRPVLDVVTLAVLGISVFDLAEDFLQILPGAIPAVTKTRKLIRHTKEQSKTIPVYVYRKKFDENPISLDIKRNGRIAKRQELIELDIAQAAIDGQQAIFNRQEESRLTKAIIEAATSSLEKEVDRTLRRWSMSVGSPVDSIRSLLFTLWKNVGSNDLLQTILGTFWDNMKTLPPERRTQKTELAENDLRRIFSGPAVLEYTKSQELKPGSYTLIIRHKNNTGRVLKKEKLKIQLNGGERYLIINK